MDLQDVKNYILRHNLDEPNRQHKQIDLRMYLYAWLYHSLKIDNLSLIGKMFGKGHATVRSALIKAEYIQHQEEFIENTKDLMEQIPFVIPKYKPKNIKLTGVQKKGKEYVLNIKVTKAAFYEYAKTKDMDIIFDFLFKQMLYHAPHANKARNPYRKSK